MIFVPGGTEIDVTGISRVDVGSGGMTLASDRGVDGSPGGLIYSNDDSTASVSGFINTSKNNCRVTGLRWRGNDPSGVFEPDGNIHSHATEAIHLGSGANNWEFDNNEMWGWRGQALNLWGDQHHVHNNRFHHNQMRSLGYGMELQEGFHYVTCNIFYKNRHAIAGTGRPGNGYVARHNIFGTTNNQYGHAIDMHGYPSGGDPAGETIIIENNTVMRRYSGSDGYKKDEQVHIRGPPTDTCVVRNNWFRHPNRPSGVGGLYQAWWQSSIGNSLSKMRVEENHYGTGTEPPGGVGAATGAATIEFDD